MSRYSISQLSAISRQFSAFFGVGLVAAFAHYSVLILLVEYYAWQVVTSTLMGYFIGGIVSYVLNRRYTYQSTRGHGAALWRFTLVAIVGFFITWGMMYVLVDRLNLYYILAQLITHASVMSWSFIAHKYISFKDGR